MDWWISLCVCVCAFECVDEGMWVCELGVGIALLGVVWSVKGFIMSHDLYTPPSRFLLQ